MFLPAEEDTSYPIVLAQRFGNGLENNLSLFLGIVEKSHDFANQVQGTSRQRNPGYVAAHTGVNKPELMCQKQFLVVSHLVGPMHIPTANAPAMTDGGARSPASCDNEL